MRAAATQLRRVTRLPGLALALLLIVAPFSATPATASPGATNSEADEVTLVLAARAYELQPLLDRLEVDWPPQHVAGLTVHRGRLAGGGVAAAVIGTGKVNAVWSTTLLLERLAPMEALVIGTAGGIAPAVEVLDLAIATRTVQSDFGTVGPDRFEPWAPRDPRDERRMPLFTDLDATLSHRVAEAARGVLGADAVHVGTLASGDTFSGDPAFRMRLRRLFDPLTVDMESAAVAVVCERASVPLAVIRCATDLGGEDSLPGYLRHQEKAAERTADVVAELMTRRRTSHTDPARSIPIRPEP